MLTITEVQKTLDTMRAIYEFDNDQTFMRLEKDLKTMEDDTVTIYTTDPDTGIKIELSKQVRKKINDCFLYEMEESK